MRATGHFGQRLAAAMAEHGPVCVGVDPHPGLLREWGLGDDVAGLRAFAMRCVEAFGGSVASVKPQSAFFERFGAAGVAVLEETLAGLRDLGTLSVLDVKRGDIGSTMAAYADAYLGDESPLRADAITVSPYLGYGALRPALDLALSGGRGVFVLALTSNPDGAVVQHAMVGEGSVAGEIVAGVARDNRNSSGLGSVGLVVGATVGNAIDALGLDLAEMGGPILAPGLGAQGATPDDLRKLFSSARSQVLASTSRAVLAAGPDVSALRAAARDIAADVRASLA